ncbi:hypothetical protein DFH27DRAFT_399814 [Peziza echinospora]|nr:hypothetical protein DFH27DRAFT_399814 [Peziza echinospora]
MQNGRSALGRVEGGAGKPASSGVGPIPGRTPRRISTCAVSTAPSSWRVASFARRASWMVVCMPLHCFWLACNVSKPPLVGKSVVVHGTCYACTLFLVEKMVLVHGVLDASKVPLVGQSVLVGGGCDALILLLAVQAVLVHADPDASQTTLVGPSILVDPLLQPRHPCTVHPPILLKLPNRWSSPAQPHLFLVDHSSSASLHQPYGCRAMLPTALVSITRIKSLHTCSR